MSANNTEERAPQQTNGQTNPPAVRTFDRWQMFYLDRLEKLCELERAAENVQMDMEQLKLLRHAIFATMLDCELAGVGDEARIRISEWKRAAERDSK